MPDPAVPNAPTALDRAWGTAGATAALIAFTVVGALFSDAPGDRAGGVRFGILLGLGLLAAALARFRRAPMVWILVGMALGQLALAFLLVIERIGSPGVVAILTAIFTTGWTAAGIMMYAAYRAESVRSKQA